jgi:2-polyprenyl-6-methoxyphenol hydroxylase-like FAD-dependent oxidoreductase
MPQLKILISGAGIAGTVLVYWLSKLGHDITVIERFPELRTSGLQLDLRGHGIEVLKLMGLDADFCACAAPEQGMQIVNRAGKRVAYFPVNKSGKGVQNMTSEYEIMRADLCRLFYDATKEKVRYVFDTTIKDVSDTGSGVQVTFADDSIDLFDLVVGADGQWSRTRRIMLGPGASDAMNLINNTYFAYFTIPLPLQDQGDGYDCTIYLAGKQRSIMTRRSNPDQLQVYLGCKSESDKFKHARRGNVAEEKEAFAEAFRGAGWKADEYVKGMRGSSDFYCERIGLVKMSSWSKGRLTLVGDAAYCPSVMTGMGTTSGVVGAYVLAGEIGKYCGRASEGQGKVSQDKIQQALAAYEAKFRPFMDQVQKDVGKDSLVSKLMMPSYALGISLVNGIMRVVSFMGVDIFSGAFLKEDIKDWSLPRYNELLGE